MNKVTRLLKVLIPGLVVGILTSSLMLAKVEYTKKEGKPCITCHTKMGSKELNDVGKCYEKAKALKECTEAGRKDKK